MSNEPRVPVSQSSILDVTTRIARAANITSGRPRDAVGVFSAYPMSTPKHARHRSSRRSEFEDTMARMFVQVNASEYDEFVKSFEEKGTRDILKVLAGDDVSKGGHGYIDFLLGSAQHNFQENMQISETLAGNYVAYYFGAAAPIFQYSGTLLNTYQDDWTMRMFRIYRDIARGSQLAKHRKLLRLRYDSVIITGSMTNFSWSHTAEMQTACPFTFSLLVKEVQIVYGGLGGPTVFPRGGPFAPQGFELAGESVATNAMQTYIGTPDNLRTGAPTVDPVIGFQEEIPDLEAEKAKQYDLLLLEGNSDDFAGQDLDQIATERAQQVIAKAKESAAAAQAELDATGTSEQNIPKREQEILLEEARRARNI